MISLVPFPIRSYLSGWSWFSASSFFNHWTRGRGSPATWHLIFASSFKRFAWNRGVTFTSGIAKSRKLFKNDCSLQKRKISINHVMCFLKLTMNSQHVCLNDILISNCVTSIISSMYQLYFCQIETAIVEYTDLSNEKSYCWLIIDYMWKQICLRYI